MQTCGQAPIDFSSDQSDVEAEGAAEEEEAAEQPARKRKARQDSAVEDAKPAKKATKSGAAELVGRVVAVPAWKFMAAWAGENFQRPMTVVLIGVITATDPKRPQDSYVCIMREDTGYDLDDAG